MKYDRNATNEDIERDYSITNISKDVWYIDLQEGE